MRREELQQLQSRVGEFGTPVRSVKVRALPGLFGRVGGEDPEDDGHAGVQRDPPEPLARIPGHIVEVGGLASDHAPDGDDRVVLAGVRSPLRRLRKVPRPRRPQRRYLFGRDTALQQPGPRAIEELLGDEAVETGHEEGDSH